MDITKYTELTGITVATGDEALVIAQIARIKSRLETMLGYPICSDGAQENLYNEIGQAQQECACPNDVDSDDLADPDEVEGNYRLFDYNEKDQFFHVDPFTTVYAVKLVYIRQGEDDQGVTIKTFDNDEIRVHFGRDSWANYIEHCKECLCICPCTECVQLAVDADWLECVPKDLLYVWADMVTYEVDCKKDIKSESIQGHSYTKFDRILPESIPQNWTIIQRYAGPHGSATRTITV